jgi:hypothetical protein
MRHVCSQQNTCGDIWCPLNHPHKLEPDRSSANHSGSHTEPKPYPLYHDVWNDAPVKHSHTVQGSNCRFAQVKHYLTSPAGWSFTRT